MKKVLIMVVVMVCVLGAKALCEEQTHFFNVSGYTPVVISGNQRLGDAWSLGGNISNRPILGADVVQFPMDDVMALCGDISGKTVDADKIVYPCEPDSKTMKKVIYKSRNGARTMAVASYRLPVWWKEVCKSQTPEKPTVENGWLMGSKAEASRAGTYLTCNTISITKHYAIGWKESKTPRPAEFDVDEIWAPTTEIKTEGDFK